MNSDFDKALHNIKMATNKDYTDLIVKLSRTARHSAERVASELASIVMKGGSIEGITDRESYYKAIGIKSKSVADQVHDHLDSSNTEQVNTLEEEIESLRRDLAASKNQASDQLKAERHKYEEEIAKYKQSNAHLLKECENLRRQLPSKYQIDEMTESFKRRESEILKEVDELKLMIKSLVRYL